eukprot:TRINITY_DN14970_c0_g1_i1.p2 TRINITY_DN14970_c0_g1~~TRINITY_DN14970_c0_g1_i1.p2  ORF type:complete len:185 (-),score=1.59 TRINITY_DN14970_c0_g1_i1:267-821(-)
MHFYVRICMYILEQIILQGIIGMFQGCNMRAQMLLLRGKMSERGKGREYLNERIRKKKFFRVVVFVVDFCGASMVEGKQVYIYIPAVLGQLQQQQQQQQKQQQFYQNFIYFIILYWPVIFSQIFGVFRFLYYSCGFCVYTYICYLSSQFQVQLMTVVDLLKNFGQQFLFPVQTRVVLVVWFCRN